LEIYIAIVYRGLVGFEGGWGLDRSCGDGGELRVVSEAVVNGTVSGLIVIRE
jgi:hypothetical protein